MIDPKTLTREHVGRMVRYTALHGETETGTISGWNEEYIFVRYSSSITGKATSPEQLDFIDEGLPGSSVPFVPFVRSADTSARE